MVKPYRNGTAERRALDAFIKLNRATNSVRSRLEPNVTRHGLTATQFGVMEALLHVGPLSQRDLGRKILASKGNVSVVVNNLERRGLVRRAHVETDRRLAIVQLTREGRRLISRIFPEQVAAIVDEFSTLTAYEQKTLARLCKKLGRGADLNLRT